MACDVGIWKIVAHIEFKFYFLASRTFSTGSTLCERRAAITRAATDETMAYPDAMPLPARPLQLKLGVRILGVTGSSLRNALDRIDSELRILLADLRSVDKGQ